MTIETDRSTVIGVDLGGTQLRAARIDQDGRILAVARLPTDRTGGPEAVILQIERMARDLRDGTTVAIGIGIPGTIDVTTGTVLNVPALPGWTAVPLVARLRTSLGLPCVIENDAKAAALGEWQAGAGRGFRNLCYVTISTGIGAAAIVDGRLLRGAGGLAGEIGHTRVSDSPVICACGLTGCWQAVASGVALDRRAQEVASGDPSSAIAHIAAGAPIAAPHLGAAARAGDTTALRLLAEHAELLGYGLTNLQHVYSPDRIVVGGGVSALLDLMQEGIERTMRERLLPGFIPASVVRAALADDAGMVGAAFAARHAGKGDRRHRPNDIGPSAIP